MNFLKNWEEGDEESKSKILDLAMVLGMFLGLTLVVVSVIGLRRLSRTAVPKTELIIVSEVPSLVEYLYRAGFTPMPSEQTKDLFLDDPNIVEMEVSGEEMSSFRELIERLQPGEAYLWNEFNSTGTAKFYFAFERKNEDGAMVRYVYVFNSTISDEEEMIDEMLSQLFPNKEDPKGLMPYFVKKFPKYFLWLCYKRIGGTFQTSDIGALQIISIMKRRYLVRFVATTIVATLILWGVKLVFNKLRYG